MSRSELQTRKEIIDRRLLEAGWNVMDRTQVIQELSVEVGLPSEVNEPPGSYQGFKFSDYALLSRDCKVLAIVEAKKLQKMQNQAGNKPNNTAIIFFLKIIAYSLFVTTPTAIPFTFGI
ncbi:MAG: hypothetical protein IPN33_21015 [Saprospiraceae bacterium]|nr:hypothetical protein [Saprospiraceae bacterium]